MTPDRQVSTCPFTLALSPSGGGGKKAPLRPERNVSGGRGWGEQGFTFLEVLTVLALMAVLLGLVAPTFYRGWERERTRAALRDLSATLRLARSVAVTEQARTRVYVDLERGRYWLEGGARAGQLPPGTRFGQIALVWQEQGRLGYIAFYGDGASSGGRLDLEDPQGRRYILNVDIITSKVSLEG
jgi:general secretion pathway protein H